MNPVDHLPLVHTIARQLPRHGLPYLDVVQEGTLGLLRACQRWQPGGAPWRWFASRYILWAMKDAIRLHCRESARVGPLGPEDEDDLVDHRAPPAGPCELEGWLEVLSPRQRQILSLWLGLDGEQLLPRQIAERLGVSRQRIHEILQQTLARIRARAGQPD